MADEFEGGGDSGSSTAVADSPVDSSPVSSQPFDEFEFEAPETQVQPQQAEPEPAPQQQQQTQQRQAFQPTQAHHQWAQHLGVTPEAVEAMNKSGRLQEIAEGMRLQQEARQRAQQPAQQTQQPAPQAPAVTPPAGFEWSEDAKRELHPEFLKHSEHLDGRFKTMEQKVQEAIDKRLADLEPRFKQIEPLVQPLQGLLQQQQQHKRDADNREFATALKELNAPHITGTDGKWMEQNLAVLGQTAQAMLTSGRARDIREATRKAFMAEFGDQLQAQAVKQVAKASADRQQMVLGSPTQREGSNAPPTGKRAAYENVKQYFKDHLGHDAPDDPDFLEELER